MSDHQPLIERVEKATAGDKELDAAIWLACFEPECRQFDVSFHVEYYDTYGSRTAIECDLGTMWVDQMEPPLLSFTASIDAALSLVERVLPECWWDIERQFVYDAGTLRERFVARIRRARDSYLHVVTAPTPALAICLALLKVVQAQAKEPHSE